MHGPPISTEARVWRETRERLRVDFPDLDDADLFDTLDGETNLIGGLKRLIRQAEEAELQIPGIKERTEELKARRERFERRAQRLRAIALHAMQEAGIQRLDDPTFTAAVRPVRPGVVITEEEALPAEFLRIETKPNKTAIGDALRAGREVPGAQLANGGNTLTIRRV